MLVHTKAGNYLRVDFYEYDKKGGCHFKKYDYMRTDFFNGIGEDFLESVTGCIYFKKDDGTPDTMQMSRYTKDEGLHIVNFARCKDDYWRKL